MHFSRKVWPFATGCLGLFMSASSWAANIEVSDQRVRSVSELSGSSAGYMTLLNKGIEPVFLESVDSDLAARTELHRYEQQGGVLKMVKLEKGLELSPGQRVQLVPGGDHIMLMGLKSKLQSGDSVDLTLHFSDGDAIDVKAPVKQPKASVNDISIRDAAVRATVPGMSATAAYFTLENDSAQPMTLKTVTTPVAQKTEIHTTVSKDGMMRMQEVDQLEVPANGSVDLKPGGYHIMLMGLDEPIKEGAFVPITLTFDNEEQLKIHARAMKHIKGQHMAH